MFGAKRVDSMWLTYEVERFLFREARLLDERKHHDWLHMLAEEFRYDMPLRFTAHPDASLEGKDAMWDVDNELSTEGEVGFLDENKLSVSIRVARSRQAQAWSESPAARTRRVVGNVEVEPLEDGVLRVRSNLLLVHSPMDRTGRSYSVGRIDKLKRDEARGFLIVHRRVIPDWNVFPGGAMSFYF